MYDGAIDRINAQSREDMDLGHRVLAWVCFSPQPLHIAQLQYALLIQPGNEKVDEEFQDYPEYILSQCAGLVEVERTSRLVRFVHGTVLQYLERNPHKLYRSKEYLATTCLAYLLTENFLDDTAGVLSEESEATFSLARSPDDKEWSPNRSQGVSGKDLKILKFRRDHPFTAYAIDHLPILLLGDTSSESGGLLMTLLSDSVRLWKYYAVWRWLSSYLGLGEVVPAIPRIPLLLAVELDLPGIVSQLVQDGDDSTRDKSFLERHEDDGSHESTQSWRSRCLDSVLALNFAAFRGRWSIVTGVLANGADINGPAPGFASLAEETDLSSSKTSFETVTWYSPLCQAILGGRTAIVKQLLELGASVEPEAVGTTEHPLRLSIEMGDASVLKLLLEHGASVNTKFPHGDSVLHLAAARSSSTPCLNILLESGAPVDLLNDNIESPLYVAIVEKNHDAVSSLIRFGASPKMLLSCREDHTGQIAQLETLLLQKDDESLRPIFQQFTATSIGLGASRVLVLFRELLHLILSRSDSDQEPLSGITNVDHQMARFNRWAGNIGVFAGGFSSLEYRLRDDYEVQLQVRRILEGVEALLCTGESLLHIVLASRESLTRIHSINSIRQCGREKGWWSE
jgi:ankyrin repeat protein